MLQMEKIYIITLSIIWFILLVWLCLSAIFFRNSLLKSWMSQICCQWENKTHCFNIEIADDEKSRQLWLMYRESMPAENWMFFVFQDPWIYPFWMKNTLIPLAWIWMDSDMKIVDIIPMDPCKTEDCPSYVPESEAKYVLEINQNLITEDDLLKTGEYCYHL